MDPTTLIPRRIHEDPIQPERALASSVGFYDLIAPIYDDVWGRGFFAEARRQFRRHLFPRVPQRARILDLCCGGGRFAAYLTGAGFDVTGVDASFELLAQAARRAPRAFLIQADIVHFQLPQACDAAVCFFNSLNHARHETELRRIFANVAAHVTQGAYFLFDTVSAEELRYWHGDDLVVSQDRLYQLTYSFEDTSNIAACRVKVRCLKNPGRVEAEACSEQRFIPVPVLRAALRAAGFDTVFVREFRRQSAPDGRVIVLARRT